MVSNINNTEAQPSLRQDLFGAFKGMIGLNTALLTSFLGVIKDQCQAYQTMSSLAAPTATFGGQGFEIVNHVKQEPSNEASLQSVELKGLSKDYVQAGKGKSRSVQSKLAKQAQTAEQGYAQSALGIIKSFKSAGSSLLSSLKTIAQMVSEIK